MRIMELSTADYFDLARVHWDASIEVLQVGEKYPWDELPPLDQAAEAEGIKSVVEELERRGLIAKPARPLVELVETEIHDPFSRQPRKWDRLEDVPHDVKVTDRTGATFKCMDGRWYYQSKLDGHPEWERINHPPSFSVWAPFTEVVED